MMHVKEETLYFNLFTQQDIDYFSHVSNELKEKGYTSKILSSTDNYITVRFSIAEKE